MKPRPAACSEKSPDTDEDAPAIIPTPRACICRAGAFALTQHTRICVDPASAETGRFLAERLRRSTGFALEITTRAQWGEPDAGSILLAADLAKTGLGPEGYQLTVAPDCVSIRAPAPNGVFYGTQTLLQLLPPDVFASAPAAHRDWRIPCVEVEDQPRFPWRGFMLDVGRHFFAKEEIERFLDLLALHKLNVFHWHLTEDQGWRIEMKKHPRLTQVGAWRSGVGFGLDASSTSAYGPDGRYGGFYTQNDVRAIVAYAHSRHITVVPEIEMPGHSSAALAAYPGFGCTGGPYSVEAATGVFGGVYCAGKEETFTFLKEVLDEVFELFPDRYVHIGGDEAPKNNWKKCSQCQARMKEEGLRDERELQSYFIRRIEEYVTRRGRSLIGWSEIREGGLARSAVVMDWIGGAVESASDGHDVVMSPTGFCYFDYNQTQDQSSAQGFPGGFLPLAKVRAFEPIPDQLDPRFHGHVLGAQGNLWTEYVPSMRKAEYMTFLRLCALAEVVWSPKGTGKENFGQRLRVHQQRLDRLSVNYCKDTA